MDISPQARFWLDHSRHLSNSIRYREALDAAERALALAPDWTEVWYVRGTCHAMLAHYAEALNDFEHALHLDPLSAANWDAKAWVLGIQGHREEALAAVDQAIALDPTYFEALKRKRRFEGFA